MAITPRILTRHTKLFASTLVVLLLAAVAKIASFGAGPQAPPLAPRPAPPATVATTPPSQMEVVRHFTPQVTSGPQSRDQICRWTAGQVFRHFDALAAGVEVAQHTRAIADLVEAYGDLRCINRVHYGRWDVNSELLGVGLIVRALRGQAAIYDQSVKFDPRADRLIPAATQTYEILAPEAMCRDAIRGHQGLMQMCMAAFAG